MNLVTIIAVLLISLLFTVGFVTGLKSRGPWASGWSFFSIVCLSLTAVSLWIPPAGPLWMGAPWVDLIATGLLVSFVLSALSGLTTSSDRSLSQKRPNNFTDNFELSTREGQGERDKNDSKTQITTANKTLTNKDRLTYEQL